MLKLAVLFTLLAFAYGGRSDIRIIGGEDAKLGEFPHQISLRFEGRHTCGGSIVHPEYILTAAHCVYGRDDPEKFIVVSGSVSLSEGGETHEVASIKYHESYSTSTLNHDIAIIKLKKPIVFNKNQKPIGLPTSDTPGGLKCKFSGWGLDKYPGDTPPNKLQKMNVVTYDNEACQKSHIEGPQRSDKIFEGMLCAFNKLNIGACKGDSGGPLVCEGPTGPIQVGVISWVWQYCALGVPDVYARVYFYRDWINKNTDNALY